MAKHSRHNKEDRRAILLAYIYRYSLLLIPFFGILIAFAIVILFPIKSESILLLPLGVLLIFLGCYNIIGAILKWKHLLVFLQLSYRRHAYLREAINPGRSWTTKEKRDMIGVGISFIFLGLAFILIMILTSLEIL